MITEDYISFETAKLLKEKRFDCKKESITAMYREDGEFYSLSSSDPYYYDYNDFDKYDYIAPTLQMAMKWLREVHKIHISVEMGFDVDNHQYYFFAPSVCRFSDKSGEYESPFGEKEFNTCEEACEEAIKYCLEKLI